MMSLISICIATYNGAKYLRAQLDSILLQLRENDEIVISDDGSTDSTLDIINSYQDTRIRLFFNTQEHGYTKNFENAIRHARGEYIFLSDQDDVWYHNKIVLMCEYLRTHALVISDALYTDEFLNSYNCTFFEKRGMRNGLIKNILKVSALGATMAFRKEILLHLLPFPPNQYLCPHDYWIVCVAEAFYSVYRLPFPLIKYRRHLNTTSNGGIKSDKSLKFKVIYRLYCLCQLLFRINR